MTPLKLLDSQLAALRDLASPIPHSCDPRSLKTWREPSQPIPIRATAIYTAQRSRRRGDYSEGKVRTGATMC